MFEILASREVGDHLFVRLAPTRPDTLADELAALITGAYMDVDTELRRLRDAANALRLFSGDDLAPGDDEIAEALAELRDALLPAGWDERRPKHTDVQRSELAEIVAADVLTSHFATVLPASRVAEKEIPDQQARGADLAGFEDVAGFTDEEPVGSVTLVLGEVKGSTSNLSPPGVVDGMATKLQELCTTRRALIQELTWLRDHAEDELVPQCARILATYLLKRLDHRIVVVPVLLRPTALMNEDDTGVFETEPESFDPSRIRFLTISVDDDLFDLAAGAYLRARAALNPVEDNGALPGPEEEAL